MRLYEGDSGHERLVRIECADGRVVHLEGGTGNERAVHFGVSTANEA